MSWSRKQERVFQKNGREKKWLAHFEIMDLTNDDEFYIITGSTHTCFNEVMYKGWSRNSQNEGVIR